MEKARSNAGYTVTSTEGGQGFILKIWLEIAHI